MGPLRYPRQVLVVDRELLEEARRQARAAAPRECCGVLLGEPRAGRTARVRELVPTPNSTPGDPRRRFRIAPESLLAAMRRGRETGLEIVGFYHSHPEGEAAPSRLDAETAWPRASYLIIAPESRAGSARSWRIRGGEGRLAEERIEFASR